MILFYRGAWCPYCKAQLAAFARARASLRSIGVEVVALSVDDEAVSAALVDKMRLNFPVGFGVKADEISAATGAYVAEGAAYLQSTGFVLDKQRQDSHRRLFERCDRATRSRGRCGIRAVHRKPRRCEDSGRDETVRTVRGCAWPLTPCPPGHRVGSELARHQGRRVGHATGMVRVPPLCRGDCLRFWFRRRPR